MAQKRMFDKAIIDTEKFMDLSMASKALYFLLGMEADDMGFVSVKKVMRIHGGNEDDVKVLLAKKFLILFDGGVVVITDWLKNNWLDSRRLKETEYQEEYKRLFITETNEYTLENTPRLATAKQPLSQYSTVQSRTVQNSKEDKLPDWLDKELWNQFLQHRKELRKSLTPTSRQKLISKLGKYQSVHAEALRTSIENGWAGVFPESVKLPQSKKSLSTEHSNEIVEHMSKKTIQI